MRLLITDAGFVGLNVVQRLLARGDTDVCNQIECWRGCAPSTPLDQGMARFFDGYHHYDRV